MAPVLVHNLSCGVSVTLLHGRHTRCSEVVVSSDFGGGVSNYMRSRERGFHDERASHSPERRTRDCHPDEVEPVVLTRKFSEVIDGIDLSGKGVGDRLPLHPREAVMLIAEGWARPTPLEQRRQTSDQVRADSDSPP